MRISDWSSDVCSSDLDAAPAEAVVAIDAAIFGDHAARESGIVAQLFERVAEHRHAVLARNMVDRAVGVARQPVPRFGAETLFGPLAVRRLDIRRRVHRSILVQYVRALGVTHY